MKKSYKVSQNKSSSVYTKPEVSGLTCTSHQRITLEVWDSVPELVGYRHFLKETWKMPGRWGKSHSLAFVFIPPKNMDDQGMFEVVELAAMDTAMLGSTLVSLYAHPADDQCMCGTWRRMRQGAPLESDAFLSTCAPSERDYSQEWVKSMRELSLEAVGFTAYCPLG